MSTEDNLNFDPKPISAVAIRFGEGTSLHKAIGIIQRTTALRAYNSFKNGRDWMEKLSTAYVVALATRSADALLMRHIQNSIIEDLPIGCRKCREATIGTTHAIRERVFPDLFILRKHANNLIHHLDKQENCGIAELNVQGVFDYCHHLFQDNSEVLFGTIPLATFELKKCKDCQRNVR
jgi:hypothetical protein